MTQACSLPSSAADANATYHDKRLPKGIHVIEAEQPSVSRVEEVSRGDASAAPWGYLNIHHFAAEKLEKRLATEQFEGGFVPQCFIHRSVNYKRKPNGKGVMKEERASVSGLVFLQGETEALQAFLKIHFPQYHLVRNCTTGRPASIPNRVMQPFMHVMQTEPERVTFLRDPFVKFAKDHVRLRVLTGMLAGQEGYVVRILRDRQLVMDFGGYAVAISHVHNEDFQIVE